MRGRQDDCSTICRKIVQTGHPVFLRAIFISEEENIVKMDKRKKIFIISILIIFMIVSVIWAYLKIFLKINNKTVEIQASKSEFNTELEENEHMHIEEDINGEKVPVPNGYVGSRADGENGIDTGYVIYEGEEEVTNENVEEAQRTRNQYVWVPVPDINKFYGIDENGKKWGKLYEFTTETGENVDEITGARPLNWSESDGIIKMLYKNRNKEPDIIGNAFDTDSKIGELGKTRHEFLMGIEKEFNDMLESVEKYGGFYVGRYETGNLSTDKVVIQKGYSDFSLQNWYAMYKKCIDLKGNNINIETGMIWGNQWDRILMWLVESGNKTKEQLCNSISWGNYRDSEFEYTNNDGKVNIKHEDSGARIPTGLTEYTKANNIYDLAGNIQEWTMESNWDNVRVGRGGFYNGNSTTNNSNSRAGYDPSKGQNIIFGCRAMLYIK